MRILLADDHPDSVAALAACFALEGFDVRVAYNGAEALAIALAWKPDAVLSDIDMPELDGHGLARRLRANRHVRHFVLIAVTARISARAVRDALAAGFDDHVAKPAQPQWLLALVKSHMSGQKRDHGQHAPRLDAQRAT